jgi:hypothetical protein
MCVAVVVPTMTGAVAETRLTIDAPTLSDEHSFDYAGTRCMRDDTPIRSIAGCFDLYRFTQESDDKHDYYVLDLSTVATSAALRRLEAAVRTNGGATLGVSNPQAAASLTAPTKQVSVPFRALGYSFTHGVTVQPGDVNPVTYADHYTLTWKRGTTPPTGAAGLAATLTITVPDGQPLATIDLDVTAAFA